MISPRRGLPEAFIKIMTPDLVQLFRRPALHLHEDDQVMVALRDLPAGFVVSDRIVLCEPVPAGHKFSVRPLKGGEHVRRYGQVIGVATVDLNVGVHVHGHNLSMLEFTRSAATSNARWAPPELQGAATFQGIVREDGRVATRNYIGVLSTVNCSATVAHAIARQFDGAGESCLPDGVDGVVAFTHASGCGMDSDGEGLQLLRRTMLGYAAHPNLAGVLVVGLGCESNQLAALLRQDAAKGRPIISMNIQEIGGTRSCVEWGVSRVKELIEEASRVRRVPVPAMHLTVGLQCGGSDGLSGITANPALGAAVDLLVAHGGTAVLSETPEIYGAEHLLTGRAVRPEVAERLHERLRWWERYCASQGSEMNNNPTPGNKAGGLSTILEKSLGAVAKGGSSPLQEVNEYAQPIREKGLVFMDTPGFDPVSATGQVAGGCNLICFTTGRGSAYGCIPSPTLKIATNSSLYLRQSDDMDLNAGVVLEGVSVKEMGQRIFDQMLAVAGGKRSRSESHGYGRYEFAPWIIGATM